MPIRSSSASRVRFGDFELELRTGELRRNGDYLKLQPQPAKVLAVLASRAGEVVTRQELAREVWGEETYVNYEQGLNFAIRQIRATLDDDADHPRYLETLPKRGYRFIATLQQDPVESIEKEDIAQVEPLETSGVAPAKKPRKWQGMAAASACGLLIVFSWPAYKYFSRTPSIQASGQIKSIAVLPLANLSADPAQEYFSDGLTDELITRLAQSRSLKVISRTSVMGYKKASKKTPEIGKELQVDALVEGTVERAQDRIRVRVQLIRTATDEHIWAQTYDRELNDVLQLETDVALEIAQQIGLVTSDQHAEFAAKHIPSREAHENYLQGRYRWNQRTEAGLRSGIERFQKAIELDPEYAGAYAGLADSYIMLANWGFMPAAEGFPKAEAAARKALELNDHLAEAEASLAYARFLYDWDWSGAENGFKRSIELNPNYSTAHHFYSVYLMAVGRQAEAQREIELSRELDPLSLIINSVMGWIYYEGRTYDKAIEQCRRTVEMDPNYAPSLLDLGSVYLATGDYQSAIAQFRRAKEIAGETATVLSYLAQGYALSGKITEARSTLHALQRSSKFVSPWEFALVYNALGEKNQALKYLRESADQRASWVVIMAVDPRFDDLRSDPEFRDLEHRLQLPMPTASAAHSGCSKTMGTLSVPLVLLHSASRGRPWFGNRTYFEVPFDNAVCGA